METTLDQQGRIELPKEVRDDLGLSPGAVLTVEEKGGGIVLRPVRRRSGLIRKQGLLVFAGELEENVSEWIRKDREDRARKIYETE